MGRGTIRIGTSGWAYKGWRGRFYPKGLVQAKELAYIAASLPTVEVNGTFYSLTTPAACERWRAQVPPDFSFAVKGSRYLTHMLKLGNFAGALANFFASGILRLGAQMTCVLWQLPPMLSFRRDKVLPFFEALPRDLAAAERWARRHDERLDGRAAVTVPDGRHQALRHAVEVRHPSWLEDEALRLLEDQGLALVAADTAGRFPFSLQRTADFAYVRLHGSQKLYSSQYTDPELADWSVTLSGWANAGADVYVYFDNDAEAFAPVDAIRLQAAIAALKPVTPSKRRRSAGGRGATP
ncbi:MAG TPA: DUF72 domain-containing protein [Polyangia bacterium]